MPGVARHVLYFFLLLQLTHAQPPGSYYSGSGSVIDGSCPLTSCPLNCNRWQWRKGCAFNSSGYCADCTNLTSNKYFSATGGITDSCQQTSQTTCSADYVNLNKNSSYAGDCTMCGMPEAGYYFLPPSSPSSNRDKALRNACAVGYKDENYNNPFLAPNCVACGAIAVGRYWVSRTPGECISDPKPTCPTGYYLTLYNDPSVNGTCSACTPVLNKYFTPNAAASPTCSVADCTDSDCVSGEYKASCGGSFSGICTKCSNGNASQIYTSRGGLNNICQVQGCQKTCNAGEYIFGCGAAGAVQSSLTCAKCNNSLTNSTYYTGMGGYLIDSCQTSPCPVCPWGFYNLGCGNLSAGTCSMCTNVV